MNSELDRFLKAEKQRIFEPGPGFSARVAAQAGRLPRKVVAFGEGVWDVVPVAARPVFALALAMIVVFFVIQTLVPVVPREGLINSYLEGERTEGSLYVETDLLASDEALGEWIVSGGGM
ncbi:MAG TPA: hypothetical protein VFY29_10720 [Terriglobia bacterium]|nr:hypothetical protein [Terriglobia bacterium]